MIKWFLEKIQEYSVFAFVGFLAGSTRYSVNIWTALAITLIFAIFLFMRDRIYLTKILNNAQNNSKKS